MTELTASRTLVKSPPELWAACSDPAVLGRHLESFGEIRITRLEPETTVAWEGERASGTVRLEPSGWGTKVTLTAAPSVPDAPAAPATPAAPPPDITPPPAPVSGRRRGGLLGWLLGRPQTPERGRPAPVPAPVPPPQRASAGGHAVHGAALDAALAALGQAHHRPYSRG